MTMTEPQDMVLMTPAEIAAALKLDQLGRALCCVAAALNGSMSAQGLPTTSTVYQSTPIRWPDCEGMFVVTGLQSQQPDSNTQFSSTGLSTCMDLRETTMEWVVGYCRPEMAADKEAELVDCLDIIGSCPSCDNVPEAEEGCESAHDWTTHSWQLMRSLTAINANVCELFAKCMRACDPIASCQRTSLGVVSVVEEGRFVALRGTVSAVLV